MKNKLLAIALALAVTLGLAACEGKESSTSPDKGALTDAYSVAAAASEKAAVSVVSEASVPATVEIAEVTDEQLAQYADYEEVDVSTDEYGIRLLLTTDSTLQDLKLFGLTWDDAAQNMVESEDGVLYYREELTPEKPLVIWVSIPGTMPTVGLAFIDADGTAKGYHIIMSGEDGSMQLAEATFAAG